MTSTSETAATLGEEMALVAEFVDEAFYLAGNPAVAATGMSALEHFCRTGWRELRKPNADFDVWWYWSVHLDPSNESVNPVVHYAREGRAKNLSTRPATDGQQTTQLFAPDRPVRRACLFAGFDGEGVIDESVIELLTELAKYSDVFYLFDGYLPPQELAKIGHLTQGSWGIRHGAYDFGSYSMLAKELVGWDRLDSYDEVLFVNDSCFLVRPLDAVFSTMDATACDWWGLQATKGIIDVPNDPFRSLTEPVALDSVLRDHADDFESEAIYNFHVGSYFLAFRRGVLDDPVFRRLIDSVSPQASKRLVIHKYEIGLTHVLLGRKHAVATYMDDLYPYHPMFSDWAFVMIERGLPLLKRYFIYQNHYDVPDLVRWKERLLDVAPEANVDQLEQTLLRTAPDDRLRRSFAITRSADGQVSVPEVVRGQDLRKLDRKTQKQHDCWLFAVDAETHLLPDNSRAIFEAVRHDPAITKVVLTRSRRLQFEGANVVVEPLLSPAGRGWLVKAGCIFVESDLRRTLEGPILGDQQAVVMVRSGLQLERSGRAVERPAPPTGRPGRDRGERLVHPIPGGSLAGILVASDLDGLATLATHWPAHYREAWQTGIPAHDFMVSETDALPADLREQLERLEEAADGRRLVLFAPTARAAGTDRSPYLFSAGELAWLRSWGERHDAVLGLREAIGDQERSYSAQLEGISLDLSRTQFSSDQMVLRASDAVITDYSGLALDFAAQGGTVVSFAHDLHVASERLLYDVEHMFPGPVCTDFAALQAAMDTVFEHVPSSRERRVREMLIDRRGVGNVGRVLEYLDHAGLIPAGAQVIAP